MTSTATRSDQSFSVFDIVRMAMDWASLNGAWGTAPNTQGITVTYPAASTETADYAVEIARDDAFDTDPVLHEIGHVYETMYNFATINPGGAHGWEDDLTANHGWSDGTGMAFNEGFADFFPVAIRQELPASDLPNGVSPAATYTDPGANGTGGFEEQLLCPILTCTTPKGLGEGNELAIARILDLIHGGFQSVPAQSLVNLLKSYSGTVNTLSQAVQNYLTSNNLTFAGTSGTQVTTTDAFGEQLASQGIAPKVIGPPVSTTLNSSHPPTFKWDTGGTPTDPFDNFNVYFFDSDNNPIPNASGQVSSANGGSRSGSVYSWTPPATDPIWTALTQFQQANGTPSTIRLEVTGSSDPSIGAPNTGPYPGEGAKVLTLRQICITATGMGSSCTNPGSPSGVTCVGYGVCPTGSVTVTVTEPGNTSPFTIDGSPSSEDVFNLSPSSAAGPSATFTITSPPNGPEFQCALTFDFADSVPERSLTESVGFNFCS
jgi:hypothetical protein